MKRFITVLSALCICFLICIMSVSCRNIKEIVGSETEKKTSADTSEEGIFSYIKEAYENTLKYDGAYTVVKNSNYIVNSSPYTYKDIFCLDSESELMYKVSENENSDYSIEKILKYKDDYYIIKNNEDYFLLNAVRAQQKCESYKFCFLFESEIKENLIGGTFNAENIEELKNAYIKVCKDKSNLNGIEYKEPEIVASYDNGKYTLNVSFKNVYDSVGFSYSLSIVAENEKIVECSNSCYFDDEHFCYDFSFTFDYKFDKTVVDDYDVKSFVENERYEKYDFKDADIELFVNAIPACSYGGSADSVLEAFNIFADDAERYFNFYYGVTDVDGWYTDEKCTKKFDPNQVTDDEWFAIKALYANAVCNEDTSFVNVDFSVGTEKLSEEYQIVYFGDRFLSSQGGACSDGSIYNFVELVENEGYQFDKCDIYVNGEKLEDGITEMKIHDGKMYYIEVKIYDESVVFSRYENGVD